MFLEVFCKFSPEFILFLASLVDKAIFLIFQAFIFQVKCLEKTADFPQFGANSNKSAEWFCAVGIKNSNAYGLIEREVSAETSIWVFYASFCHYIPAFFTGPITGYIGDHYSRKWALGIPIFGLMVGCIEMVFIANYAPGYYQFLLIGWFVSGVFGSIFIFIAASYAIVAHRCELTRHSDENQSIIKQNVPNTDLNKLDDSGVNKTARLAILQATIPFGCGVGVLISSLLIDIVGPAKTFAFIAIVSTITFIYLVFCLEDIRSNEATLTNENESFKDSNILKLPYTMMADSYYVSFCKARKLIFPYGREMLTLVVLSLLTFTFCFFIHPFLDYLYLTLSPRNFTTTEYGIFNLLQYTFSAATLAIILPSLVYILRELGSLKINTLVSSIGLIALALDLLILSFANTKLIVYLSLPFNMFHSWPFAGMRVIISDLVTTSEVGTAYLLCIAYFV